MKEKRKSVLPQVMLLALCGAAATFFILLHMEKNMLQDFQKIRCLVAKEDIPAGFVFPAGELENYVELREIDQNSVPQGYLSSAEEIAGSQMRVSLTEGSVLLPAFMKKACPETEDMASPVLAGVRAEDLFQVVSGILRSGDHIDIYTVDEETGEVYLLWERVLVYESFDAGGNRIPAEDDLTAAARLNLLLEEPTAGTFYEQLNKGALRVVKIWE